VEDANHQDVDIYTKTLTSAQDASAKITGYVVMDVDVNTLLINDEAPDANAKNPDSLAAIADGVAIIIVDKKAKTYQVIRDTKLVSTEDPNVFVDDANYGYISEETGLHKADVVNNKKGDPTKKTLAVLDLGGILRSQLYTDVNGADYRDPGEYDDQYDRWQQLFGLETMTGALKNVDLDGNKDTEKVSVPTSLKGLGGNIIMKDETENHRFIYEPNAVDPNRDLETTSKVYTEIETVGTATLKLDKKLTQTANTDTPTTAGTVAALKAALEDDDYTQVKPPAVPY
jgi:hypothetical protein